MCVCVWAAQSFWLFFDSMDCSLPGSSVHGILQARILEQIAIFFSRGSSDPRIEPMSLASPEMAGRFFATDTTMGEAHELLYLLVNVYHWIQSGNGDGEQGSWTLHWHLLMAIVIFLIQPKCTLISKCTQVISTAEFISWYRRSHFPLSPFMLCNHFIWVRQVLCKKPTCVQDKKKKVLWGYPWKYSKS